MPPLEARQTVFRNPDVGLDTMEPLQDLKLLYDAIDETPIIDNHAHPLLKPSRLGKYPIESIATEASGDAIHDTPYSLAHIRATRQLAEVLNCEATWEDVEYSIQKQRVAFQDAWIRRCMQGIETILLDDGLDDAAQVEGYAWHDGFVRSRCKRIVRIESVAEDVITDYLGSPSTSFGGATAVGRISSAFRDKILQSIADPEVVGFKSIICYRGGLDMPPEEELVGSEFAAALDEISEDHLSGRGPFKRLQDSPLNYWFVHLTAKLIEETSHALPRKPIQFHTGLGDNDITLTKSSPSHLQTFIRDHPTVPIVLLHASYPWTREAGYLAAMYANVYADVGEVFPFISRDGQERVVRQILELCPWSKILWSTDGHWFPETYMLATMQVRDVLKTVLGDYVRKKQLEERQAVQLVRDVLFTNAKKLYNLPIDALVPISLPLTPRSRAASTVTGRDRSHAAALQDLRQLDCKWLRVYWHDYTSTARCRMIPMKRVYKTLEDGKPVKVSLTKAALGLLQTDVMIPGVSADGVYHLLPDWSSLKRGPAAGHVSCYGDFCEEDGSAAALCPRTLLRTVVGRAATHGLSFLLGHEIEYVVMERDADPDGGAKYRPLGTDGHAWSSARALAAMGRAGSYHTALEETARDLEAAGTLAEGVHAESAPGQYEVILPARAPLDACDALLHARQIIVAAAARHGFHVTLHPKPYAASCGTAAHTHVSVRSRTRGGGGAGPDVYEPFYAGVLRRLRALAAFTYASPASYERAVDGAWAGGRWISWGAQNKEAPLRKCAGAHWELRAVDHLANPYLAAAATLAAGTAGVLDQAPLAWKDCRGDPARLSDAERARLAITHALPADLPEALRALEDDAPLARLLGESLVRRYLDVKRAEISLLEPMTAAERRAWLLERY